MFGEVNLDMKKIELAKSYGGLLRDELLDLVETYKIGNPRADGIRSKINGLLTVLDEIEVEAKPKPERVIIHPVKKPNK